MIPDTPTSVADRIKQGSKLPLLVNFALATASHTLSTHLGGFFSNILLDTAKHDPYFDSTFTAEAKDRTNSKLDYDNLFIQVTRRFYQNVSGLKNFTNDPILWALTELGASTHIDDTVMEGVFPIIEDIIMSPEEYQVDLSSLAQTTIMGILSDFAAGLSMQSILEAHTPKFRPLSGANPMFFQQTVTGQGLLDYVRDKRKKDDTRCGMYRSTSVQCWYEEEQMCKQLKTAGTLLQKFYDLQLPCQKPTRAWREKALQARATLDKFWEEIRETEVKNLLTDMKKEPNMSGLSRTVVETWKDIRILDSYKETAFADSIQAQINEDQARKDQAANKRKIDEENERQKLDDQRFSTSQGSPPKKTKVRDDRKPVKRRDQPTPDTPSQPPPTPRAPTPPPSPEKISASATSLDLFARMWPHQSRIEEAGTIRFKEVVAAMADVGFPGTNDDGGSMWHFKGPLGAAVLHSPHGKDHAQVPRGKLMFYGKQLEGFLGWEYKRFTLRGL